MCERENFRFLQRQREKVQTLSNRDVFPISKFKRIRYSFSVELRPKQTYNIHLEKILTFDHGYNEFTAIQTKENPLIVPNAHSTI